ncbi:Rv1476 family membrane protein [Williamsia phyllosphaerae]|uniref:TPM domain-containing protein n=1 Tax=Williamsia phyllosphaerae TaxID=885042 RepID=A0ABQ1V9K2_9NOCA|nr:DUF6676 family protein [Williamsia phyllosphaerae]GGF42049.1 hypothetical protein GCM10007298_42200 [Williamsia phyllosphaerae]
MAPTASTWVQSPAMSIIPANVDLTAIEADLADDHVAAPADIAPRLTSVVSQARDKGHDMYFVVLSESQPKFTYFRDIATALQEETGGTVVVFGPGTVGSASDDFSRVQLEQAQDNLSTSNPPVAAQQLLDRMTDQTQVPWTVVTIALIVVVALGAVAARILGRRRAGAATSTNPTESASVVPTESASVIPTESEETSGSVSGDGEQDRSIR